GILIEPKSGYSLTRRFVRKENVIKFEGDTITVDTEESITSIRKKEFESRYIGSDAIRGCKVFSRSGQELGFVEDYLFDPSSGLIEGVELSDGIVQDVLKGRNTLPFVGNVEFAEESIIVGREAVEEMTSSGGGLLKRIEGRNSK
ncbi:MAG: PRC-barrel domain-containing protein, partial [Eubacteriales bacterium]|nr:PRC-barrel domain-containing protein [Eubacteriales bacterium]